MARERPLSPDFKGFLSKKINRAANTAKFKARYTKSQSWVSVTPWPEGRGRGSAQENQKPGGRRHANTSHCTLLPKIFWANSSPKDSISPFRSSRARLISSAIWSRTRATVSSISEVAASMSSRSLARPSAASSFFHDIPLPPGIGLLLGKLLLLDLGLLAPGIYLAVKVCHGLGPFFQNTADGPVQKVIKGHKQHQKIHYLPDQGTIDFQANHKDHPAGPDERPRFGYLRELGTFFPKAVRLCRTIQTWTFYNIYQPVSKIFFSFYSRCYP